MLIKFTTFWKIFNVLLGKLWFVMIDSLEYLVKIIMHTIYLEINIVFNSSLSKLLKRFYIILSSSSSSKVVIAIFK